MKKSRCSDEQIVRISRKAARDPITELAKCPEGYGGPVGLILLVRIGRSPGGRHTYRIRDSAFASKRCLVAIDREAGRIRSYAPGEILRSVCLPGGGCRRSSWHDACCCIAPGLPFDHWIVGTWITVSFNEVETSGCVTDCLSSIAVGMTLALLPVVPEFNLIGVGIRKPFTLIFSRRTTVALL